MIIGIISDTHGLLRPEALAALQGSEYIIHAGDIGDPKILDKLAAIAPITAVRGNVDHGAWAQRLLATNVLEIGEVSIYVLHSLQELDLKPEAPKFAAVRLRAQPQAQAGIEERRALFQSRQRGAETFQTAGECGAADD